MLPRRLRLSRRLLQTKRLPQKILWTVPFLSFAGVKVEDHSSWEDRKSEKGLSYRTADARLVLNKNGFMIPLYVKGVITRGEGKTVYTVFAADQASGRYFQPLLDKALKEAKK